MSSTKSFNYPFRVDNKTSYGQALETLNTKLDTIKKQISYFDSYNITEAVSDSSMFSNQINSLPSNEALVINCSPFIYNSESFAPGDIVLKLSSGQIVHIKSLTGGVYYPSKMTANAGDKKSTYTVQYTFSGASPSAPTAIVPKPGDELTSPAKKIIFQNLVVDSSSNIYGIWDKMITKTYEIEAFTTSYGEENSQENYSIRPFIQFFLCTDVGEDDTIDSAIPEEQIMLAYTLEKGENKKKKPIWKVTVDIDDESFKKITNLYIKVK